MALDPGINIAVQQISPGRWTGFAGDRVVPPAGPLTEKIFSVIAAFIFSVENSFYTKKEGTSCLDSSYSVVSLSGFRLQHLVFRSG
jgi:hypothetical protein